MHPLAVQYSAEAHTNIQACHLHFSIQSLYALVDSENFYLLVSTFFLSNYKSDCMYYPCDSYVVLMPSLSVVATNLDATRAHLSQ